MWSDVAQRPAVPAPLSTDAAETPYRKASAVTQGFLQIDRLSKAFVPAKPVFADVSFTLDKGEFVCIIGHSGCGKTTILNVLAGLDTATSGTVIMDGREVAGPSLDRGVVFQGHALMPWLTVRKNIAFAVRSKWPDWPAAQVDTQVEKYVAMVGLSAATAAPGAGYRYDKTHLVPFGEFIPPLFRWFTNLMRIPLGDFARGA